MKDRKTQRQKDKIHLLEPIGFQQQVVIERKTERYKDAQKDRIEKKASRMTI